jgi:hypothetical protein
LAGLNFGEQVTGTAFLSAIYGLIYSISIIESDEFARRAHDYQVERSPKSSRHRAETLAHLEELISVWRCRTFQGTNEDRVQPVSQNVTGESSDQPNTESASQQARCRGIADAQRAKELAKELDGPQGPDKDPHFPKVLLLPDLLKEPETLFAYADGEKEISFAWRQIASGFLRSLTLFAISLYLFGQSLGLGRSRAAFMLFLFGIVLAVAGAVGPILGKFEYRIPDEKKVLSAAEHYGAGRVFYETYKCNEAAYEFQAAHDRRPTFALADRYLAASCQDLAQLPVPK